MVVPLRPITNPRLELSAALLSVKVSAILEQELEYTDVNEIFWTDSQVVLGYINSDTKRFRVFVAKRVQQIHDRTQPFQWRYVKTKENPADDASRGLSPRELVDHSKWLTGPDFIWTDDISLNTDSVVPEPAQEDPELKKVQVLTTLVTEFPPYFEPERSKYFSDGFGQNEL